MPPCVPSWFRFDLWPMAPRAKYFKFNKTATTEQLSGNSLILSCSKVHPMINWSRPHLKIVTPYYLSQMQVLFFWSSYDLILVRMDFDQSVIKKNILFVSVHVCLVNVSTSHNMLLTFRYWYVYISVVVFFLIETSFRLTTL